MELLKRAEVVVYDYLANPQLLQHCPQAELIYVGKMASRHQMTQEQINALLVEKGLAGKRVVRLKGGDPFVFGRGGEEALSLVAAGVRWEVVPGITSAIAATAYAGIPITYRDANSSMTLITGHEKENEYKDAEAQQRPSGAASDVDWASLAKLPCVAFYMGVKGLPGICRNLIEHGMDPAMPAAAIQWGTMPRQRTVVGTISDLPEKVAAAGLTPPAITVVGRMVELRAKLNWFESRPLFGQTVVVTRTRNQASDLSLKLEELGARVIEAPTIDIVPPADQAAVDAALRGISSYDWVIFTSANGVTHSRRQLNALGMDVRAFGKARVAVIGEATAEAVRREFSLEPDLMPKSFVAEALADELEKRGEAQGKRFLLLRADIARPVLRERLEKVAATVLDVPVYESKCAKSLPPQLLEAIDAKQVTWVTFTSSSTAANFVALLGGDYKAKLAGAKLASIGPITTKTMKDLGLPPTVEAGESNIAGLVEAMAGKE
jgi:uroporphyrinogen III methyltransferase/synthase